MKWWGLRFSFVFCLMTGRQFGAERVLFRTGAQPEADDRQVFGVPAPAAARDFDARGSPRHLCLICFFVCLFVLFFFTFNFNQLGVLFVCFVFLCHRSTGVSAVPAEGPARRRHPVGGRVCRSDALLRRFSGQKEARHDQTSPQSVRKNNNNKGTVALTFFCFSFGKIENDVVEGVGVCGFMESNLLSDIVLLIEILPKKKIDRGSKTE